MLSAATYVPVGRVTDTPLPMLCASSPLPDLNMNVPATGAPSLATTVSVTAVCFCTNVISSLLPSALTTMFSSFSEFSRYPGVASSCFM